MKNPKQLDLFSKIPTWKKRGFKSEEEFSLFPFNRKE